MRIRRGEVRDIPELMRIYDAARAFMRAAGNAAQWTAGYPSAETIRADMARDVLYVCENRDAHLCGVFALIPGDDPTYAHIEGGAWQDDSPYATIHRAASDGTEHGVFRDILAFARVRYEHLRADTHEDNAPMRHCLTSSGFIPCGTIYVHDRSPRIAYEWSRVPHI